MLEFQIPTMTCGHCARSVTQAVQAADPSALVQIDLPQKKVVVDSDLPREQIVARLAEAGFAPA
ncbi:MAG: heavy-metal-associated domain-containing protein [Pseudomonadota bacterium]|jgi:copper chaperone|nr:heavy-metal-associated domain-containing protein [Rubrivivax sp.]MCA3257133.1 heavy-metal-associated domain-containing protein [Rubrivivax sp.]MCE2913115.1 heavy-metal-associated domain-containing protein [Rubrivivax sp.]MCZ8030122.1 heavy-metal-associated domain-containing protein [Rubrivivax sp.]